MRVQDSVGSRQEFPGTRWRGKIQILSRLGRINAKILAKQPCDPEPQDGRFRALFKMDDKEKKTHMLRYCMNHCGAWQCCVDALFRQQVVVDALFQQQVYRVFLLIMFM